MTFDEPSFQPHETYRERTLPNDFYRGTVGLDTDGHLSVRFFGSTRLRLERGQFGRLVYNEAEDVTTGGWYRTVFHKVVVSVAFDLRPQPDLFRLAPDQEFVSVRDMS